MLMVAAVIALTDAVAGGRAAGREGRQAGGKAGRRAGGRPLLSAEYGTCRQAGGRAGGQAGSSW